MQGSNDYNLTYKYTNHLEMVCYSDSNFDEYLDNKKSTLRYIFLIARGSIF